MPFPPTGRRFEMLEEQLAIVTGLWQTPAGERFAFSGRHYALTDSPALPKPVQRPRPPIVMGGWGAKRTPRLAARFADEFNVPFPSKPADAEQAFGHVRAACGQAGRDAIRLSIALTTCCGRTAEEVTRRAEAIGHDPARILAGTPAALVDRLGEYAAAGASRAYLQILDLADLDHVELIAAEVMPQL
jgi:alkanesulfonate monooxygenase SsuD/methylene tetrahydromethanopterin reductase-like flavin-dependent oxidoreductase (luciferase family)